MARPVARCKNRSLLRAAVEATRKASTITNTASSRSARANRVGGDGPAGLGRATRSGGIFIGVVALLGLSGDGGDSVSDEEGREFGRFMGCALGRVYDD